MSVRTSTAKDPRSTRRYKAIAHEVIKQEPRCWLRFARCKGTSTTADHVITVATCLAMGRPDLVTSRANMRGACTYCNFARGNRPVAAIEHLIGAADRMPALSFFD